MFSTRARTLSGLSSFLTCSFGLSGSRYPSFHWPSPLRFGGRLVGVSVIGWGSFVEPAFGRAVHRWLSGGARSGGQLKVRGGLGPRSTHQGRQQQVQTRLKSTCRRATNATRCWKLRAAVTLPIVPRPPAPALTGGDLRSR